MKKSIIISLFALAVLSACNNSATTSTGTDTKGVVSDSANTQSQEVYKCPMDCEKGKTYAKPGKCPVCGMDLKKV